MTLPLRPDDPEHLGGYALLARLGEGGMGTVYLGRDGAGRLVAVKVLRAELAADRDFVERFRREAEAARRVAPFCTAQLLDVRLAGERPLLVTEYVDGPTLQARVAERGPLPPSGLEAVAVGVVAALTAIHRAGLVHRDLKPDNILLSPEGPRVIDFGIARDPVADSRLTQVGVPLGTPPFMAPEQFTQDEPASAAADVFAWGGVVAFAATGRLPFGDGPVARVAYRVVHERPDLDGLGGPLRELAAAALAKDPVARPSAQELLLRLLDGPTAPPALAGAAAAQPAATPGATQVVRSGLVAGLPAGGQEATRVLEETTAAGGRPGPRPAKPAGLPGAGWLALAGVVVALLLAVLSAAGGQHGDRARPQPDRPAGQPGTTSPAGPPSSVGERQAVPEGLPDNLRAEVGNLRQRFGGLALTAYDATSRSPGTVVVTVPGGDAGTRQRAWEALDSLRRQAGVSSPGAARRVGDLALDCTDLGDHQPGSCLLRGPRGVGILMSWTAGPERLAALAEAAYDRQLP